MKYFFLLIIFTIYLSHASDRRPNILFFFADDWGRHASVYIDPEQPSISDVLKTPHIDRIAKEGVLFKNAFTQVASCAPSRACLSTGRSFWRNGSKVFKGDDLFTPQNDPYLPLPKFVDLLTESGYFSAKSGKTLYFKASKGLNTGPLPSYIKNSPFNNGGQYPRYGQYVGLSKNKEEQKKKHEEIGQAVQYFTQKNLASVPKGQPFFYIVGPTNTHRSYVKGSREKLWGIQPKSLIGKIPKFLPDVEEIRRDFSDYAGEIQALDYKLGIILKELEKIGELDNTLIILSGDHGMPGVPRGKTTCYDFGVRVPLLIRYPKMIQPGRSIEDFVTLTDLAPTLLELAGLDIPDSMDSQSFLEQLKSPISGWVDLKRDYVITGRERHVGNARSGNLPYPIRAIRSRDYLYIHNFKPQRSLYGDIETNHKDLDQSLTKTYLINHQKSPQVKPFFKLHFEVQKQELLYQVDKDPYFMNNLAQNPEMATELDRLKQILFDEMKATGDLRLEDQYDRYPWTGPIPNKSKKK